MGVSVTPAAISLPLGDRWVLDVEVRDDDGALVDVATSVAVDDPAGVTTAVVPVLVDAGRWRVAVPLTLAGRYVAAVAAVGAGVATAAAYAIGRTTAAGMPNAEDCATYMGADAASWSAPEIADALLVEAGAQRDRCRVGAAYPDPLRGALLRRVQRNLAMRRLPLAMPTGDADAGAGVLPGRDPEVRRLEAPYRRLPIG